MNGGEWPRPGPRQNPQSKDRLGRCVSVVRGARRFVFVADKYAAEQRTMLYYPDLSAYRPIPQSSFHSRRMPHSEWLYCRIRQLVRVQHRNTLLWKFA